jgi:acetolactate synthase I/II/III large subunit
MKEQKVSEYIAEFLEANDIKHVFGIIGAGNAHIFDAITQRGFTQIICVHHEQAACMAIQTYYRTCGKISAALLTTGAGSTNGVTGVVSAWADSIPGIIISGNENLKYVDLHKDLRMWGVQGYDSTKMVEKVTKFVKRVKEPNTILKDLQQAHAIALHGRPGPVWVDVPLNIQSTKVNVDDLEQFDSLMLEPLDLTDTLEESIDTVVKALKNAKRPVLWLGHGIRLAGGQELVKDLVEKSNIPSLITWAGIDMINSNHDLVYGRAGTYGQRCANFVVQNCDFLLCIGTRMAISQIGYEINELARDAEIVIVDIDKNELAKYSDRYKLSIHADAKEFISLLIGRLENEKWNGEKYNEWIQKCNSYRETYPWYSTSDHPDTNGFLNSYRFINLLNDHLKDDQVIVTDMGTALLSGHQTLKIKDGQRLMTSTGLGEMGYGLPGAIGASFAKNKGEVMCLNCDGGMMMNLQELQTVVHHKLPIKLFIFNNDGYLMIKHTQNALFSGRRSGVDINSGVSCPNFTSIARAFDIPSFQIKTIVDFESVIPQVQAATGPVICEVFMDPQQPFFPKLSLAIKKDGTLISPPLEDLSPFLSREELQLNMINGLHDKSKNIHD